MQNNTRSLYEVLSCLGKMKEKSVITGIFSILIEIERRVSMEENTKEMELYEDYYDKIKIYTGESYDFSTTKENRRNSISSNISVEEYRRMFCTVKISELGRVLNKYVIFYTKKFGGIQDKYQIVTAVHSIFCKIEGLIDSIAGITECKLKIVEEIYIEESTVVNSLLLCLLHVKNFEANIVLSILKTLCRVEKKISSGRKNELLVKISSKSINTDVVQSILVGLAKKGTQNLLCFLLEIVNSRLKIDLYFELMLYAMYREEKTSVEEVGMFYMHSISEYIPKGCSINEFAVYYFQILCAIEYHKALSGNKKIEKTYTILRSLLDLCSGSKCEYLSIRSIESVFSQKSLFCILGTLTYITRETGVWEHLESELEIEMKLSIYAVMALLYKKVDYAVFMQAVKERIEISLFYVHCVLVVTPEMILQESPARIFKGLHRTELFEYTLLLYKYGVHWNRIKKNYADCKNCKNRSEYAEHQSSKEIKRVNRKKKLCGLCTLDRVIERSSRKTENMSILYMVIEGDTLGISKYLAEHSRTPSALVVFLEKVYPRVSIPVKKNRIIQHLDPSEYFMYTDYVKLLPEPHYEPERINRLKNIFSTEESEKRTIWLLFLESVVGDIYGIRDVLTDFFHLQILIRSQRMSERICKRYSKKREEEIIRLSLKILEDAENITEQEKNNVYLALKTVSECTPIESISNDIRNYLHKKHEECVFARFIEGIGSTPHRIQQSTKFTETLSQAKDLIEIFSTVDIYSTPQEIADKTPIDLVMEKYNFFKKVDNLSPIEQSCIKEYFNHKHSPYEMHLQSHQFVLGSHTKVKEIVEMYYTRDLKERQSFNGNKNTIKNQCIHLVNALIHTIYPEKYFLFFLLTKVLKTEIEFSMLEVYSINHALEYLYAYDRELFRELFRLCKIRKESSSCAAELAKEDKRGKQELQPIRTIRNGSTDRLSRAKEDAESSISTYSLSDKVSENLSPTFSLTFKRHGSLCKSKQKIILAKYQNRFFTKHYNYSTIEGVFSEYFNGIISIANLKLLLFISEMPSKIEEILEKVPCAASHDFLKIFYYTSYNLPIPPHFSYYEISQILQEERNQTENTERKVDLLNHKNEDIDMYINKNNDDGFITSQTAIKSNTGLLEINEILKASEKLSIWSKSINNSNTIDFLFCGSMQKAGTNVYVDFLKSETVQNRYRFIDSVKRGNIYSGRSEIEEILYICTRKITDVSAALARNRTLTKSGMYCALAALEKKWFKMHAESYYMKRLQTEAPRNSIKLFSHVNAPSKVNTKRRNLAAHLFLFKIDENIDTFKDRSLVLDHIEKECTFHIDETDSKIIPKDLSNINNAEICEKRKKIYTDLLARVVSTKIQYIVKEFEKKPIDILNNHIKPAAKIDFGKCGIRVLETLAKTCLTIFNRHTMNIPAFPVPVPAKTSKAKSSILQKEEAAAKELEECKVKQHTEVEKTAHFLGTHLSVKLVEKSQKIPHVISLIHFLFTEHAAESTIKQISLDNIPIKCFFPLKQQIISKYFYLHTSERTKTALYLLLSKLIERFLKALPFFVVYDLILRETKTTKPIPIPTHIRVHAESVIQQYKNIYLQAQDSIPISAVFPDSTPVLSCAEISEQTQIYIHTVLPETKQLKGINKPVLISIRASNGIIYREILKKNDDLKQDILSTQVFMYMNTVLSSSRHTQTIKERVRIYNIVALDKLFGIIQFISSAEPIGAVIEDLHSKYYPSEIDNKKCREIMQKYIGAPLESKVKVLNYLQKEYSPVLKKVFEGKGPFEYCKQRKTFSNSFAITSIATYILGLGDRHPQNILLDRSTQELVNIDLNLIFDQARALSISEKVPFRMTRNLQQGIITAEGHSYEKVMCSFLEALKESKENLLVFVSILQSEPLHRWKAIQKIVRLDTLFSDYKSVLGRLKDKLNGIEDGFILSNTAHIQCLIQRAVDISNQASIYPGWSPWM